MNELDEFRQKYDRLSEQKMPSELKSKIYRSIIEKDYKAKNATPRYRLHYGWIKGAISVLAAVCIVVVVSIGVLKHRSVQSTTAGSPETAVQQWIDKNHPPGVRLTVTNNIAVTANGDFVAAKRKTGKGTTSYNVFYTSKKHGEWNVQSADIKYDPKTKPLPATAHISLNGKGLSCIGIGVPKGFSVNKVIVKARFKRNGKDIALSLTKVGTLSLWVYNLTADRRYKTQGGSWIWMDSITAYNNSGKVLWSRKLH